LSFAYVGLCPSVNEDEPRPRYRKIEKKQLLFYPNGLNLDKASGIGRLESTQFVHGRLLLVVETLLQTSGGSAASQIKHGYA
jgi:hypothetical protein